MKQLNSSAQVNRRSIIMLVSVMVLCLGSFLAWKAISGHESKGEDYISQIDRMQAIPPQLALSAIAATEYDEAAYDKLLEGANLFSRTVDGLVESAEGRSLPVKVERLGSEIDRLRYTWGGMELYVRIIAASKPYVFELHRQAQEVNNAFDQLQPQYDAAVNALLRGNDSARNVSLVQGQTALIEKARLDLQGVLAGQDATITANRFQDSVNQLVANHNRIINGAAGTNAAAILRKSNPQMEVVAGNLGGIYEAAPAVYRMGQFADRIAGFSTQLLADTAQLNEGIDGLFAEQLYARLAIVIIILLIVAFIIYRRTDRRLKRQFEASAKNQEAILRLLDELADLADGDLTVNATVTEDFTGAIADSINYAIDQLRSLVVSINETSVHVSQSADETRSTAIALSDASIKQAAAITEATDSINNIVSSMDNVATNADESSKVAGNSVEIANKGASAVQNTIHGMDKIREQIQKTSKQIKRLGESSQEIGDIISLINDIADQTNILSLNAAIQASMAGDAGRGFAVVADEVQRLAERSGAATKQIEVLVKAIQADTNEAVISMEQTTAEVVQGARLAQDAGVALEEIEEVSNNLAQLIQGISSAAGAQSKAAVDIASTMGLIKEITSQTSSGTQKASTSIGNLAELAKEMRQSVSGFTLPGEVITSVPLIKAEPEVAEDGVVIDDAAMDDDETNEQDSKSAASVA